MPSQEIPDPYRFAAEQWLPYPVEVVFAFFAMPENLPRISPPWQKVRIEEAMFRAPGPRPASSMSFRSFAAGAGTRLTISMRPFPFSPIRLPWRIRISEFLWNEYFADEQEDGPFRMWRQVHRFAAEERAGRPGTLLRDSIEYALPLEPVAGMLQPMLIRPVLQRMFAVRHTRTGQLLAKLAPQFKAT